MSSFANINRASYNRPNISIGKRSQSTRALSERQFNQVKQTIVLLNEALNCTTAVNLNYKLSTAYRNLYHILKERNG